MHFSPYLRIIFPAPQDALFFPDMFIIKHAFGKIVKCSEIKKIQKSNNKRQSSEKTTSQTSKQSEKHTSQKHDFDGLTLIRICGVVQYSNRMVSVSPSTTLTACRCVEGYYSPQLDTHQLYGLPGIACVKCHSADLLAYPVADEPCSTVVPVGSPLFVV